jgi:long-chain acyl-CoA synthetase
MLKSAVDSAPDSTAVICGEESLSYAQLGRSVAGLASALLELDSRGARIAILVPNSIENVVAFFAAMAAHGQAAPVNPFYRERELARTMDEIDPRILLCVAATRDAAQSIAARCGIPHVMDLEDPAWSIPALEARAPDGLAAAHLPTCDDRAVLIMTGGTTGTPKGVDHHHRNLLASVLLHCTVWPVAIGSEILLNVAPLFHIWGLGYAVLVSVFARSTFVLVPRFEPGAVLAAIERHRVTIFGGGPAPIYAGLVASDEAAGADYSSLKYCLSGGAPCPESLHRRWLELTGCPIFEGWGMSEGAPLCINPAAGVRKLLSVGPPVPETAIEIVDVDTGTRVLTVGERGEVRVRGPQLMSGYRNNPQETAAALRDGWMHTGDIGYVDDDGYLFLVDRKKDMVIVGGYNVYPREVDELLCLHSQVREATAVGRADERLGEVLVAFVVPVAGAMLTEETCLEYCRTNLVKYKRPVAVYFVDALPRTAANKIDKLALRRTAADSAGQVRMGGEQ